MGPCKSINDSKKPSNDANSLKSFNASSTMFNAKQTPVSKVYGIRKFGVDIQPEQELNEPLKFHFQLSKFRCKMLKEAKFYLLQILFDKQLLPLAVGTGSNPKFQLDEAIEKDIIYKDLENSDLEIFLYTYIPSNDNAIENINKLIENKNSKANIDLNDIVKNASLYSSLKVDLLTIAIGPEHHDLVLVEPKKSTQQIGRISYCVSCNHIENIALKIQTVNIQINSLLKNELSLKLKFKDSKNQMDTLYTEGIPSQPNAKEEITSYEYHPLIKVENILNVESKMSMRELRAADASVNIYSTRLIKYNRRSSSGLIPKRIGSTTQIANPNNKDITLVTYYTQIGFSTLNFYKILYENDSHILKQTSKFFQSMSNKNQWNQLKYDDSIKERFKFQVFETLNEKFEDEIYWKGTSIGKITMNIEVKNIPLIRQIMCGVMTETGFEINSIFLYDNALLSNTDDKQYNSLPYELQTLMKQKNQLELAMSNNTQLRSVSSNEKDFNIGILKYMNEIKDTLSKSIEEDCLYYGYSSIQDLYQGQAVMLELGLNCLEIIDKLNMDQRAICFDILRLINERSEFDLGTLSLRWFTEDKKRDKKLFVFKDNVLIEKKIIENFIQFNNEALRFALECIARGKNIDNDSKKFSLFFLSSAYFRIPCYRDHFINSILKETNQPSTNQKHKQSNASIDDLIDLDPINSLILWDKLFYKKLASCVKSTQLDNEIFDQLRDMKEIIAPGSSSSLSTSDCSANYYNNRRGDWKDRLSKRDFVFFDLLISLDSFLQPKMSKGIDLNWLNIPGFDSIILAINHELRDKEVKSYPKPLLEIISMFTNNITIINSFTRIIMHRTNVFDTNAVFNTMNYLDMLFNRYESRPNSEQFKSKFDYNCLFTALKVIITTEHSLSLSKCLWFYYKNSHLMSKCHLTEVINSVFFNNFYSLFFHWSYQVRNVFYYLILFTYGHRLQGNLPSIVSEIERPGSIFRISSHKFSSGNDMSYLDALQAKMVPIQEIQNIIYTEELNPSFNSKMDLEKFKNVLIVIPEKVHCNILVSISHYEKIEVEFSEWKGKMVKSGNNNNPVEYPIVNVVPPRDDIVDYAPD